ncbi:G-type lectin S-receptor-like serine/threonine-protein kinase LECRK3 [Quercus robur]|uniref:G-type lectin S-receptor-like serine/threonine-protein kinase LECRK3 n=1 Tax=Quercus robur TaxID=38942 RepID=UPI002163299E|nr:G-type lectin S-receptor-like serine/threonine-protein kinase LECRK3 [Quercus robur]
MASILIVFLVLSITFVAGRARPNQPSIIRVGNSLTHTTSWPSPSNRFAFGFYQQGSGFAVGIWLVSQDNKTVVWTANRDDPLVTSNAMVYFKGDELVLLPAQQEKERVIASSAKESFSYAAMLDSGNFVLYDTNNKPLWQSFENPTDTILGRQLSSSLNKSDHSTGQFDLRMQEDGNLVLYPVTSADTTPDAYWSSGTYNLEDVNKNQLYLDFNGTLILIRESTREPVGTVSVYSNSYGGINANNNNNTIYRATLDVDGIFRLYSHTYYENGYYNVSRLWLAPSNPCDVKGSCGFNSFCTPNDNQNDCRCLPGHDFVDPNRRTLGCERNFSRAGCSGAKENATFYYISTMENMTWGDIPYFAAEMSMEECRSSCLEDCNCGAALFKNNNSCQKQQFPLRYVRRDTGDGHMAFFKVGHTALLNPPLMITSKAEMVQIVLEIIGFTVLSCVALAIFGSFIFKIRVLRYKRLLHNGKLGLPEEVTLRLFTYNELKRVTKGFKEELGKGSFGAVYKGALGKGKKLVAVKRLEKLVEEGEREFRAEMRAIGRTHHRNLVRLLGFCTEDSKRLLVYEYMSNGSLADLLFGAILRPDWTERLRIALDVARGILYLHEECEAPIIHCDIKPKNILMDDCWNAKISDFGLAKFLMPDQTRTFTGARGARGYVAPEWHKNIPISVKADVYSYGIVLLEIVCCRKNIDVNASTAEEIVLSSWAFRCYAARELYKLVIGEEVDKMSLEKMVQVGLWCIQEEPALRPSMKSVVLMLEGMTEVPVPPCPTTPSM